MVCCEEGCCVKDYVEAIKFFGKLYKENSELKEEMKDYELLKEENIMLKKYIKELEAEL